MTNPTKFESKDSVKTAVLSYYNYIRNLEKITTIEFERKQVLPAIHQCKKTIESTVGTRTHVKPAFFTVDIFAVQKCRPLPPHLLEPLRNKSVVGFHKK